MKKIKNFTLIAIIAVLSSCQKEPKADFSIDKPTCTGGETVLLTNISEDASSYMWYINGQTFNSKNLQYTTNQYSAGETVNIILYAYSKNGKKSDQISKSITVTEAKGSVLFWAAWPPSAITVTLNGQVSYITQHHTSAPDCGDSGCANFDNLTPGTYNFTATDNGSNNWASTVTIYSGTCSTMQLTF